MTIDFAVKLLDLYDNPIQGTIVGADGKAVIGPATLASVAIDALSNAPASLSLSNDEKIRAYKLIQMLMKNTAPEIIAESIALIKRCIGASFSPVVVGRCFELLDPAALTEKEGV